MNGNACAILPPDPRSGDPWDGAPLPPALAADARALIAKLDERQRLWMAGYLAGSLHPAAGQPVPAARTEPEVLVLFGSHTGNSAGLARRITTRLSELGIRHALMDMLECRRSHLQSARSLLAVVSTQGDGEPPERARELFELLAGRKAPRLEHLQFAVLALGDSSYEKFCAAGRQLDARLEALGAARLQPRVDCDVDFESAAQTWIDGAVHALQPAAPAHAAVAASPSESSAGDRRGPTIANAYTRKQPFLAPVLTNQRLTAADSSKDVRHVELSIDGANLHYEPGDALGVVTHNRPEQVQAVLARLPFDPHTSVPAAAGQSMPLRQALTERHELGPVSVALFRRYAEALQSDALRARLGDEAQLARYLRGRHLVDLLAEHPADRLDPQEFARLLPPLAPRLYSIASSQRETPDEVHLTVSVVDYAGVGGRRRGLASGHLADLAGDDAAVPVYLHRNGGFRLPSDPAAPLVMIGPGTGVAPFRAFLAERAAQGAGGRNWLFFGDRRFESDFLYQAEWLEWRRRGVLAALDVAFSRDGAAKIYVQHRMAERGAQLWSWLEEGAYLYVCGDAEYMAPDVHRALLAVIERHGGRSAEQAQEYVLELQRQRRYQRDVY